MKTTLATLASVKSYILGELECAAPLAATLADLSREVCAAAGVDPFVFVEALSGLVTSGDAASVGERGYVVTPRGRHEFNADWTKVTLRLSDKLGMIHMHSCAAETVFSVIAPGITGVNAATLAEAVEMIYGDEPKAARARRVKALAVEFAALSTRPSGPQGGALILAA